MVQNLARKPHKQPASCTYSIMQADNILGEKYKLLRHNVYVHPTCVLGHNSVVTSNSIIGAATVVGNNSRISNSVIGNKCHIEDGCELSGSLS